MIELYEETINKRNSTHDQLVQWCQQLNSVSSNYVPQSIMTYLKLGVKQMVIKNIMRGNVELNYELTEMIRNTTAETKSEIENESNLNSRPI